MNKPANFPIMPSLYQWKGKNFLLQIAVTQCTVI